MGKDESLTMTIITLLTDFGTSDPYVAEVKAVLLSGAPGATLVDVTHDIRPGDIRSAAFVLGRTWHRFPLGTVHLAVVDPGVGTPRPALLLRAHGHIFVGPDNGIFSAVLHDAVVEAVELHVPAGAAPTFHGRDLFAPAAAAAARGCSLHELGEQLAFAPRRLAYTEPRQEGRGAVGEVIYVDRFGTLVTNLPPELARDATDVRVEELEVGPVRRTFSDVPSGAMVAFIGSGRTLEVAVRDGSATDTLHVGVGARVELRY
jgi:S-adenosyl-L-methionine hydrolase (adenosine-forming)